MKLLLLFFAALLTPALARADDLVRLGNLKFAHYGAVSYMKELAPGYGLRIDEHVFAKGIDIVPAILSGDIDLAASAVDAAISARVASAKVFIVAGFAKGGARLVVGKASGISTVAGLKGKKVGVPRGGAQELLLFAELSQSGLTWSSTPGEKDVQILYLAYADLNQALQGGQIDAMSQSEPQSSQSIARGYGVELKKPYDTPLGEPSRALLMTEALYRDKPDVARRVLECFVAATKAFLDDPKRAEAFVREKMFKGQLSHDDYAAAMANASFTTDITREHVQTTADLMVKYGVGKLAAAPDAGSFVQLELLHKAKAALGVK